MYWEAEEGQYLVIPVVIGEDCKVSVEKKKASQQSGKEKETY